MKKLVLIIILAILILLFSIWIDPKETSLHSPVTDNLDSTRLLKGQVSSNIAFETINLPLDFILNQSTAYPGDCISLYVKNAKDISHFTVIANFYEKPITFFPYKEGYIGFIPIYAWLTIGDYKIEALDNKSNISTTLDLEILPKNFDVQYLKVNETTSAIYTNDNAAKDQVYFDEARSNPIQEKLWEGPFVKPAEGEITTDYNATRYTNDNPTPSRHLAIDIANLEGTPIIASNHGKVVLAKALIVTGNSVVIDHGMGLFTSSFHLSEINVEEGEYVAKGDLIGKMGSTGYSTGSHLHFAVWKEGTFINPWYLFDKDPSEF